MLEAIAPTCSLDTPDTLIVVFFQQRNVIPFSALISTGESIQRLILNHYLAFEHGNQHQQAQVFFKPCDTPCTILFNKARVVP